LEAWALSELTVLNPFEPAQEASKKE